jgi:hypothetical protein
VSLLIVVGSLVVHGGERVDGVLVFKAPVGKLLGIVVAAVIELGFGGSWFWFVEGIEDILDSVNEGFFVGIFSKIYPCDASTMFQVMF